MGEGISVLHRIAFGVRWICAPCFLSGSERDWAGNSAGGGNQRVGEFCRVISACERDLQGSFRTQTKELSRNNILIGLVSNGEGWHNNHHAEPRAAAHGHRWWEPDVTYLTIRALAAVGLAWDLVPA